MSIWDNIKQRVTDTCNEVKNEVDKHRETILEPVGNDEQTRKPHDPVDALRHSGIPVIDVHDAKEAFAKAAEPMEGERPVIDDVKELPSKSLSDSLLSIIETARSSLNKTSDQANETAKAAAEKASDSVKENIEDNSNRELPSWLQKTFGVRTFSEGVDAIKNELNGSSDKKETPKNETPKKDSEPRFCGMSINTLNKLKVIRIIHAKEDGTTLIRVKGLPVAYILDSESFKDTGKWAWKISQKVFITALKQQTKKHSAKSVSEMVGGLFKKK